ncbi:MAG: 30S ribosomal protein S27ae [Candidatus Nanoarchaeia archaeon]
MPKKEVKNKKPSKKYTKYKVSGDSITREPICPRCGAGVFLAKHKNRQTCGSCGYTVFLEKK